MDDQYCEEGQVDLVCHLLRLRWFNFNHLFSIMSSPASAEFLEGKVILIDKEIDWTSFDVVNKLRRSLRTELDIPKIKVGHAGTLDPLATGLVIICTGRATKTIESFQDQEKEYVAEILRTLEHAVFMIQGINSH